MRDRQKFNCPHCAKFHKAGHPKPEEKAEKPVGRKWTATIWDDVLSGHRVLDPADPDAPFYSINQFAEMKAKMENLYRPSGASTELIVGYRIWHYKEGYLRSAVQSKFTWPHRKALTKDIYDDAGIHAVKDYKQVPALFAEYCGSGVWDPAYKSAIGVAGSVYLWGEVKEHEIGYLAEFAYPKELFVGEMDPMTIMTLEENYGVPVTIREELKSDKQHEIYPGRVSYKFSYSWLPPTAFLSPSWTPATPLNVRAAPPASTAIIHQPKLKP